MFSSVGTNKETIGGSKGIKGGPAPIPLKNHKAIGFLSNTGTDTLKNRKVTKRALNVGQSSALPLHQLKKYVVRIGPSLKKLFGSMQDTIRKSFALVPVI